MCVVDEYHCWRDTAPPPPPPPPSFPGSANAYVPCGTSTTCNYTPQNQSASSHNDLGSNDVTVIAVLATFVVLAIISYLGIKLAHYCKHRPPPPSSDPPADPPKPPPADPPKKPDPPPADPPKKPDPPPADPPPPPPPPPPPHSILTICICNSVLANEGCCTFHCNFCGACCRSACHCGNFIACRS